MMKLHLFITKKGKAYKIRFTFLCYFRLNIQKQCMFFQNTRVSNFKMNKNTKPLLCRKGY